MMVALTLFNSEMPKLYTILAFLSAIGLNWSNVSATMSSEVKLLLPAYIYSLVRE